jgi:hypothetical protein
MGIMRRGRLRASILRALRFAEHAALEGDTTPATIDLEPNNERLEDSKPHPVNALRELVRRVPNKRCPYRTCPLIRLQIQMNQR